MTDLYSNFQRHADQRSKLGLQAARKALDIADDDMNINASKSGIGAAGAAGIALAAGLPSALIAALMLLKSPVVPTQSVSVTQPAAVAPAAVVPDGTIVQEQRQPDGTYKPLWSLPAKLLPDGTAQTLDSRKWRKGKDGTTWEETQ